MISHPEFGPQTTATEAAKPFAENIRGKTSELIGSIHLFLFWPLYLSWLACEKKVHVSSELVFWAKVGLGLRHFSAQSVIRPRLQLLRLTSMLQSSSQESRPTVSAKLSHLLSQLKILHYLSSHHEPSPSSTLSQRKSVPRLQM